MSLNMTTGSVVGALVGGIAFALTGKHRPD
jgi:hypothetical protein